MKISDLKVLGAKEVFVETNTDSLRHISREWDKEQFIAEFGDVEIILNPSYPWKGQKVYSVPSFAERRAAYSASKAKECAIWGCE